MCDGTLRAVIPITNHTNRGCAMSLTSAAFTAYGVNGGAPWAKPLSALNISTPRRLHLSAFATTTIWSMLAVAAIRSKPTLLLYWIRALTHLVNTYKYTLIGELLGKALRAAS